MTPFQAKLDRIAARAAELRTMMAEGIPGEAIARVSKELSDMRRIASSPKLNDPSARSHTTAA